MKVIGKLANGVVSLCAILSFFCIVGILLLAVLDVILRVLFNSPITGATEISQMLMVGAVLGTGGGILTEQNIEVDIVVNALPQKARCVLELFTVSASILIYGLIAWRLLVESQVMIKFGKAFSLLKVPYYPFYWLLALGLFGGCIGGGLYLAKVIRKLSGKNTSDTAKSEKGGDQIDQ